MSVGRATDVESQRDGVQWNNYGQTLQASASGTLPMPETEVCQKPDLVCAMDIESMETTTDIESMKHLITLYGPLAYLRLSVLRSQLDEP